MNVVEILREAVHAVTAAEVPDDLRVAAFEAAIVLAVGGPQTPLTLTNAATPSGSPSESPASPGVNSHATGRLQKAGHELGIPDGAVERLFDEHDGEPQFVGNLEAFGKTKAGKVQALALLFIAARQLGGYDEGPTLDAVVRKEIDRHGLLDTSNYSKHLAPLKPLLNFNGSGASLNFKMKYEGRQRAKVLASTALGQ